MKLTELQIQNFRSIDNVAIAFPAFFTALCGKNDSGKTNVIRALRAVTGYESGPFTPDDDLLLKRDLPTWHFKNEANVQISVRATFLLNADGDAGLYLFLQTYLKLQSFGDITVTLESSCSKQDPEGSTSVYVNSDRLTQIQADEVRIKFRSTHALIFHNSTELLPPYFRQRAIDVLGDIGAERESLESATKRMNLVIARLAKQQQKALGELLGRLQDKYKVGVSVPEINPSSAPLAITLGDDAMELEQWGSGTQNRTKVLLSLFQARRLSQVEASASKITPIVVIEEPESFLHPSAQGEFGRLLQDLANEFQVQVVVATHSPYMLSCQSPSSNVLLERIKTAKGLADSKVVNTDSEEWMKPFALALGLSNEEFEPWRKVLFKAGDALLLVEGPTDAEYLEMLKDPAHGANRLSPHIEIVPYGGTGNIRNSFFLKFLRGKMRACVVTYDLDAEQEVLVSLTTAGFDKGSSCFSVGSQLVKSIEGLVPESITKVTKASRADLFDTAMFGDTSSKKSAKNHYKKAVLEDFKRLAKVEDGHFKAFYPLVKSLNKALCTSA